MGLYPEVRMRSRVQKLFHVLKSTAEGIQPMSAMTKAIPAGVVHDHVAGTTVAGGGADTVRATATTVDTNSTEASTLMTLSRVLNCPINSKPLHAKNSPAVTSDVREIRMRAETPSRLSKNAPVTIPTAAMTKKHVPRVKPR